MGRKTKAEYLQSMQELKPNLYAFGEKVENVMDFPLTRANINAVALTYELADERPILTATSHLTGEEINRFTHIHVTQEDLLKRIEMMRWLTPQHGGCVGARCVGCDGMQAVYATTYDMDQALGTSYHESFKKWLTYVQQNDLSVAGMMTDIKGDRRLRPGQQPDPDSFVHVVERRDDGIIVRGAKAHMSGAPITHEFLVMPTESMTEGDADFALSFAIPNGTEGVTQIMEAPAGNFRWLNGDELDRGNWKYGIHGASLVVFDNVFVPWDRVFMCGEYEFSGSLVGRFADMHRYTFIGCKSGHCDLVAGACALAAEGLGVEKVGHIKEKLTEIVEMASLAYGTGVGSGALGTQTASGSWVPDTILVNAGKVQGIKTVYRASEIAAEIAGGVVCTMPSQKDLRNPEIGPLVDKYFKAVDDISAADRIKLLRLIEYFIGQGSVIPAESLLGGGAPAACRTAIRASMNLSYGKKCVQNLIE
jgi:4-hydroxybutyryl-CoA dehydratase/vinylacetyl-CoA-Delta-isomerase